MSDVIDERTLEDYRSMMADTVRMDAYSQAIAKLAPGRVVAEIGAGLGPLSLMALRAGAPRAYAVEMDPAALALATLVARRAGYGPDRFVPVAGRSDEVELPESVDLVLSETVDGIGEGENTSHYLEDARRRWLRPGGRIVPQRMESFVAVAASGARRAHRRFWASDLLDRYGLDYGVLLPEIRGMRVTTEVKTEELLTDWARWASLDFESPRPVAPTREVEWTTLRAGPANGLAFAFRLRLCEDVVLDTRPHQPATHWKQGWIDLPVEVPLPAGLRLRARLEIERSDRPWLALRAALDAVESDDAQPGHGSRAGDVDSPALSR